MGMASAARRALLAASLALVASAPQHAFAQNAPPFLPPPGATADMGGTHATDFATNRNYLWDADKNTWTDAQTGAPAPSPSVQDPALAPGAQQAQKDIEEAIAACDRQRFEAGVAALKKLIDVADTGIQSLQAEIERASQNQANLASGPLKSVPGSQGAAYGLSAEQHGLRQDRGVIEAMLANDRGRFGAKCSERPARSPSTLEIAVLSEINAARTDPHAYAGRLRPAPYVDITDAAAFLANHAPIAPLILDPRVASVAIAHEEDQGPKGGESHTGSDGSRPSERMRAAGVQTGEYAEVISVGYGTAGGVVQQLLVDQPGPQHPHRDDLFDPNLAVAGVGCGPSTKFVTICVIDLASSVPPAVPLPLQASTPPEPGSAADVIAAYAADHSRRFHERAQNAPGNPFGPPMAGATVHADGSWSMLFNDGATADFCPDATVHILFPSPGAGPPVPPGAPPPDGPQVPPPPITDTAMQNALDGYEREHPIKGATTKRHISVEDDGSARSGTLSWFSHGAEIVPRRVRRAGKADQSRPNPGGSLAGHHGEIRLRLLCRPAWHYRRIDRPNGRRIELH